MWDSLCVYDIEHYKITSQPDACVCTERHMHFVRSLFHGSNRCRRFGLYSIAAWKKWRHSALGAGPFVAQRNREPIPAGYASKGHHKRRCKSSPRCALDNGRRAALQGPVLRRWRDLGRSACTELYGDQTVGNAGGGKQGAMLVDSSRSLSRSECGAGSLAHCLSPLAAPCARLPCPRRTALAGGIVPLAYAAPWHLGCRI